ncbi:hypothetical protein ABQF31_25340 [Mycobacterium syngnathidarum]
MGRGLINSLSEGGMGMGISSLGSAPAGDPVLTATAVATIMQYAARAARRI